MNRPFKEIKDILKSSVKKTEVVILGVCFFLTPVESDASVEFSGHSFKNVEVSEEPSPVTASCGPVEVQLSDNQDKWQTVLDELAEYPDNWDAEGARAISKATIDNCRRVLKETVMYESLLDDIFPTEFGTVCLQWYKPSTDALVNAEIAPDRMAFYSDEPGRDLYNLRPAAFGKETIDKLVAALQSLS